MHLVVTERDLVVTEREEQEVLDSEHETKGSRLGFIGIGLMGEAMTRRLLDQGWQVSVWNLEPERLDTVVPFGAIPCSSPALVAETSDIVLVCVLHTEAVEPRCARSTVWLTNA